MDEFSELIYASFTPEEVTNTRKTAQVVLLAKNVDNFVDAVLQAAYDPYLLVDALRQAAEDVEHAYEGLEEDADN